MCVCTVYTLYALYLDTMCLGSCSLCGPCGEQNMHKITIVLGKCKWYVMMQCNLRASRNSLQQPAPLAEQESGQESAWDAPTAATRALAAASTSGGCALQLV